MEKTRVNWRFPGSYEQTGAGMKAMDDMREYVRETVYSSRDVNGAGPSPDGAGPVAETSAGSPSVYFLHGSTDTSADHRHDANVQCCMLYYGNGFSQKLNASNHPCQTRETFLRAIADFNY